MHIVPSGMRYKATVPGSTRLTLRARERDDRQRCEPHSRPSWRATRTRTIFCRGQIIHPLLAGKAICMGRDGAMRYAITRERERERERERDGDAAGDAAAANEERQRVLATLARVARCDSSDSMYVLNCTDNFSYDSIVYCTQIETLDDGSWIYSFFGLRAAARLLNAYLPATTAIELMTPRYLSVSKRLSTKKNST